MADSQPHPDRRRVRRKPGKRSLRVTFLPGTTGLGANLAAAAVDVSEAGMAMVTTAALVTGQEVSVTLDPGPGRPIQREAEVVWCRPQAGGGFQVGLRFRQRLEYADV